MKDEQSILEEYKKGNFEARLNLFLECRHLRDEFVIIDHEEYEAREKEEIMIKPVPGFWGGDYYFRRLLRRCRG